MILARSSDVQSDERAVLESNALESADGIHVRRSGVVLFPIVGNKAACTCRQRLSRAVVVREIWDVLLGFPTRELCCRSAIHFSKPERSIAFDAGIEQNAAKDKVRLSATYFYTRLKDIIGFGNVPQPIFGTTTRPVRRVSKSKGRHRTGVRI